MDNHDYDIFHCKRALLDARANMKSGAHRIEHYGQVVDALDECIQEIDRLSVVDAQRLAQVESHFKATLTEGLLAFAQQYGGLIEALDHFIPEVVLEKDVPSEKYFWVSRERVKFSKAFDALRGVYLTVGEFPET